MEPIFHTMETVLLSGAGPLLAVVTVGWLAMSAILQLRVRKRRKLSRGFRSMKSVAQQQRERAARRQAQSLNAFTISTSRSSPRWG